jgi:hypothetical protein
MQDAKLEPAPLSGLGSRRMRSSMERQAAGAARAQIGLRAGQPPHVARALALQRTAGNRAVAALAHRTLTRRVLDQADPLAAWRQLTPSGLFTTRGSENPELLHIDALLGRLQFSGPGGNEVVRKKDVLLRLRLVLDQWLVRGQREQTLKDRRDALVLLREEVNAQIAGETSVDWIDESWGGYAAPTHAIDPGRNAFDEYVEKGGMPADLKQTFLDDYKRIRALLTDKVALRKHFAILEQRMEEGSSLSGALKSFETALGFAERDVIPLGILDTPTFLGLIRGGIAFKDFGAGIKHGEWTHRLQWFAIAAEITEGFTKPRGAAYNHTPLELYRYLASPDTTVGHGRYKKTIFGNLLDLGGSSADRYNQPDRLHMDLIGVSSWNRVEDAVVKGADWTIMEDYLVAQTDLPLLRGALLEKASKRAREDADARGRHGPAAADAQYKAEYRHKKQTQSRPYVRDAALSGGDPAAAVLVRDR